MQTHLMSRSRIIKEIIAEGLAMDSAHSYIHPSSETEAEVLMQLALGVAQRNSDKLAYGAKLSDKEKEALIKLGVSLIEGKTTPEQYAKKLEKALGVDLNPIAMEQIKMRVAFSYGGNKGIVSERRKTRMKNLLETEIADIGGFAQQKPLYEADAQTALSWNDEYNWFIQDPQGHFTSGWEYLSDAFKDGLGDGALEILDDKWDYDEFVEDFMGEHGYGEPGEDMSYYDQDELDNFVAEVIGKFGEMGDSGQANAHGWRIVKRQELEQDF